MRTSIRAALLFAVAALVALQVAQPVSGHLLDREVFENVTPTRVEMARRGAATPINTPNPLPDNKPAGTGCSNDGDCTTGVCNQGKCVPKQGQGPNNSFCNSDAQCTSTSYCYRGSCQDIKEDGHACYKDSGCASGNCINKKCVADNSQKNGQGCTKSTQCKDGSFCNNQRCTDTQNVGAYCYKDQGCKSGICRNNKCVGKGLAKLGQYCDANNKCESQLCFKSACRAKRPRDQPCSQDATCISNKCRRNRTCA